MANRHDCAYSHRIAERGRESSSDDSVRVSDELWPKKTPDPLDRTPIARETIKLTTTGSLVIEHRYSNCVV